MTCSRSFLSSTFPVVALVALLLALPGCASQRSDTAALGDDEIVDPFEGVNRAVFGLNEALDILYIGPASTIYHEAVPEPVQGVVRNVVRNLEMPVIAVNKLLQGNVGGFGTAVGRFFINTIAGVGGLVDVASKAGLPYEDTDFGVTLASWGVDPMVYVVLPLFGPSSLRDGLGRGVDWAADPVRIAAYEADLRRGYMAVGALRMMDARAGLETTIADTRRNSLDTYATFRSLYAQHRAAEVRRQLGPGHK